MLRRYLFGSFAFLFGLIWALVGTAFMVAGTLWFLNDYNLQKHGVTTTATVVEKLHSTSREKSSIYSLKYVYNDRAGAEHVDTKTMSWERWRNYEDGDNLEIVYLPKSPARSSIAKSSNKNWWVSGVAFGGFGSLFAIPGWFLLIRGFLGALGRLRLVKNGNPVQGEVTGMEEDRRTKINNRHPLYLTFKFTGVDGREYTGRTPNLPRKMENRFHVGEPITVVYDRSDMSRFEADVFGIRSGGMRA